MSRNFFRKQLPVIIIASVLIITLVAWKEDRFAQTQQTLSDTLPKKNDGKAKDFDEVMKELDKAQIELERSLKNIPDVNFNAEKIRLEIEKSMKDFDPEKL